MKPDNGYYLKFNLVKDPFPVDTFDNILYLTPQLQHRVKGIKKVIAGGNRLVLICGAPGAGKSTLADYLESIPEQGWMVGLVPAAADMSREKLAYEIIQQVSPDKADDPAAAIAQLHRFLEYSNNNALIPVFIIDDADELPVDTLKFILELAALRYLESAFRFVLFADDTLADRLEDPRLNAAGPDNIYKVNLPALTRNQLKEYLDTRLSSAGDVSKYPFDEDDLSSIYRTSGGLPRGVNILASRLMWSQIRPEPARPGYGRMVVAVAGIAITGALVYYNQFQGTNEIVVPVRSGRQEAAVPVRQEPVPETSVAEANTDVPSPLWGTNSNNTDSMVLVSASLPLEPDRLPAIAPAATIDTESVESSRDTPAMSIPPVSVTVKESAPAETPVAITALETTVMESPAASAETLTPIPIPDHPGFGLNDDNIYNLDKVPANIAGIKGNIWYRGQPPGSYTLQLISASDLANVEKLLADVSASREDLSGYVKYTPSGRPRFLLFYGMYADQNAALAAVATLPAELQAVKPWPRSVRSITNEIDGVLERIRNVRGEQ